MSHIQLLVHHHQVRIQIIHTVIKYLVIHRILSNTRFDGSTCKNSDIDVPFKRFDMSDMQNSYKNGPV